ncbi:MAG: hypothetical protein AMXMBFR59_37610 [Rhodanobacteraceae bacterium]
MLRSIGIVIAIAALSGCSGVFNPYVKPNMKASELFVSPSPTGDKGKSASACDAIEASVCDAMNLAEGYRVAYLKAAGNQQYFRNGMALAGLTAAAATLYYGLQGREIFKDRVLRLGTLGAATYATGTYLTSSPRQQVYLHGATAMSCAIIAAAPFLVPKGAANELRKDLDDLANALAAARKTYNDSTAPGFLDAISDAENTYRDGLLMQGNLQRSGLVLRSRIQLLANEVNQQALAQLPDLGSMYALAGAMSGYAQTFGSARLTTPPAGDAAKRGASASSHGGAEAAPPPEPDVTALKDATRAVRKHLEFANAAAETFDDVAACSPEIVATAFVIEPNSTAVTLEKGKTFQFLVTDASGHPSAKLTGASVEKVGLEPVQAVEETKTKYRVVIKGLDATGQKGPELVIRQSNGVHVKTVSIMVSAPPAPAPADTAARKTDGATTARNAIETALLKDPLRILAVQCVVGAKPDCLMGTKTRDAVRRYKEQRSPGTAADDSIDAALQSDANKLDLASDACKAETITCGDGP